MTGIEALAPFIRPEERGDPPFGPFDKNCSALRWSQRKYGNTNYISAFIPTSRLEDFLEGGEERGGCNFYV